MSQTFKPFISVGIDGAADFSEMAIALPSQQFLDKKTFRIYHLKPDSLAAAVEKIKKAEELHAMKVRIFMESTGIYHYPLFCYLKKAELDVSVINPLITNSNKNSNIRKVKNDKFDAKKIALMGLNPHLKVSNMPEELIMNFRNLTREYYHLSDIRASYALKLGAQLRIAFPQFKTIFSNLTGKTSLMVLKQYPSPEDLLKADRDEFIHQIAKSSRRKLSTATKKYDQLIQAATQAKSFGAGVRTNFYLIQEFISFIEFYDQKMEALLQQMTSLVEENQEERIVKQLTLLESIKGVGFLSALTLMCEIGDFTAFKKPKQLFAYFGLDPSVNQSGNFNGSRMKISKRGSRLARRVIHMVAVQSIGTTKNGVPKNPVLREFYLKKCQSGKPKMVALGAVSHKICNLIFAVLRDQKPYVLKTPEEHRHSYASTQVSNTILFSTAA